MRVAEAIELDAQTERELRALSKGRRVEARVQQRACVILLAAQGRQNKDIADEVKLDRRQVALWRRRFIEGGLQALLRDAARSGRTPSVTFALESLILSRTLQEPPTAAKHWSTRTMASHLGLSATTIRRVWQRNGVSPHLHDTFEVSRESPRFEDKLIDVVGLYMSPLVRALAFSCGERSRSQSPNHTQPARAGTMTHPHRRNDTTSLFAALKTMCGPAISIGQDRNSHEEVLRFLREVDRKTPKHLQLHLIVENHASHKHPEVHLWLARHPRLVLHLTPANASWVNTVRRFFRRISEHHIRRDSFANMAELQSAMKQYIEVHQPSPKPFIWATSVSDRV
ncbi:MAG: IS630 family transposase [Comamonadaceae bacterium]|nr:IS630 family transposase [Comamonadaceae bacterium]